jgi:hypothetical protein
VKVLKRTSWWILSVKIAARAASWIYGDQKGTSQTTARRLGEFLGPNIIKDKGLNCKFIIAEQPYGAPLVELQGDQSVLLLIKQDGRGDVDLMRLMMQRNRLTSQKLACLSPRKVSVIGWYRRKRYGESLVVRGSVVVPEMKDSAEARLRLSLPRSLVPPLAVWKDTFAMQP